MSVLVKKNLQYVRCVHFGGYVVMWFSLNNLKKLGLNLQWKIFILVSGPLFSVSLSAGWLHWGFQSYPVRLQNYLLSGCEVLTSIWWVAFKIRSDCLQLVILTLCKWNISPKAHRLPNSSLALQVLPLAFPSWCSTFHFPHMIFH